MSVHLTLERRVEGRRASVDQLLEHGPALCFERFVTEC